MRILHVIPGLSANTGGPAFGTVDMALALQRAGSYVSIFTTDMATPAQARRRRFGVRTVDLPAGAETIDIRFFPVVPPRRWAYSPSLRAALARHIPEYDIVHVHSLFLYPQFIAARIARQADIPYVVSPHGALDPHLRRRGKFRKWVMNWLWQRKMLNCADSLHLTSIVEGEQVAELRIKSPLQIGPYGIDSAWFGPLSTADSSFRSQYFEGFSGPLVVFHGRLTMKKGLEILVEAFARIVQSGLDARLAIIGPDDEHIGSLLRKRVFQLGIEDEVTFVGILRNTELRSALAAGDVWAMPSFGENFGKAVVEAQASGLPIVITPHISIAESIRESGAGLIAAATAEGFAAAILTVIRDGGLSASLRERGLEYSRRYNWSNTGSEMSRFYERLIGLHPERNSPA